MVEVKHYQYDNNINSLKAICKNCRMDYDEHKEGLVCPIQEIKKNSIQLKLGDE